LGDGTETRDFIYIDDVVSGLIMISKKTNLQGETYNLARGKSIMIRSLAELICQITNKKPEINFSQHKRLGDPDKWVVDVDKISELGFQANFSLEQGLRKTYRWFQEYYD
jgi:nucleoside-diphosphate-sugar epimerase